MSLIEWFSISYRNCEDIAMSMLVANATSAPPIWVKGSCLYLSWCKFVTLSAKCTGQALRALNVQRIVNTSTFNVFEIDKHPPMVGYLALCILLSLVPLKGHIMFWYIVCFNSFISDEYTLCSFACLFEF